MLSCGGVPLVYRVFYGFLAREGLRAGEAINLQVKDLDLKRGAITLDENKTDDPRSWALDRGVVHTLTAWLKIRKAKKGTDLVFVSPRGKRIRAERAAVRYRRHLKEAKINRPALLSDRTVACRSDFVIYAVRSSPTPPTGKRKRT